MLEDLSRRDVFLWMIPLFLLVTGLVVRGAAADAIWYDEWWTMNHVGITPIVNPTVKAFPIDISLQRISRAYIEPNPPGYYLAINLWSRLTGNTGFAMRSLSMLGGLLMVACVYRAGVALHSKSAGLYAAILIGTSAFFITYAHEARAYMYLMLFSALALFAYWRAVSPHKRLTWISGLLLSLGIMGMLYSHYMSLPILAAIGIYHLVTFRSVRRWWFVTGFMALGGLSLAPWLPVVLSAAGYINVDPSRDFYARTPLQLLQRLLERFSNQNLGLLAFILWFALRAQRYLWIVGIIGFLAAMLINAVIGFVSDVHYLLALFPVLALIAGVGLSRIPFGRSVIVGVWIVGGVWLSIAPPRNLDPLAVHLYLPWIEAEAVLTEQAQRGDHLVFALPAPDPNWLHQYVAQHYLYDLQLNLFMLESLPDSLPDTPRQQLAEFSAPATRLWVLSDPDQPPPLQTRREMQTVLDTNFVPCAPGYDQSTLNMRLYVPVQGSASQTWTFGDGIELALIGGTQTSSTGAIQTALRSTLADNVPRSTYSVGLHVENTQGQLVAQADVGLPDDATACRVLQPNAALPPASYTLYLTVYAWETGERLEAIDAAGDVADRALVGTVDLR